MTERSKFFSNLKEDNKFGSFHNKSTLERRNEHMRRSVTGNSSRPKSRPLSNSTNKTRSEKSQIRRTTLYRLATVKKQITETQKDVNDYQKELAFDAALEEKALV